MKLRHRYLSSSWPGPTREWNMLRSVFCPYLQPDRRYNAARAQRWPFRCLRLTQINRHLGVGLKPADHRGRVVMKTETGGSHIVDVPWNEQLPRIC